MDEKNTKPAGVAKVGRRVAYQVGVVALIAITTLAAIGWVLDNWSTLLRWFSFGGSFWGAAALNVVAVATIAWCCGVLLSSEDPTNLVGQWKIYAIALVALFIALLAAGGLLSTFTKVSDLNVYQKLTAIVVVAPVISLVLGVPLYCVMLLGEALRGHR
ncbi:hypothetical protein [Achromobacter sp. 413638]|uniref:hypothetical protein n=1 Tax=Achromobacter sp. 413638 TaxID=3342385 RepID=UPI00370C9B65